MPEVSIAGRATNFGACLSKFVVFEQNNCLWVDRLVERRPTTVTVELGTGDKQFCIASAAGVEPSPFLVEQFAGERTLGACFAQNVELFGGEYLTPLGVGSLDRGIGHESY